MRRPLFLLRCPPTSWRTGDRRGNTTCDYVMPERDSSASGLLWTLPACGSLRPFSRCIFVSSRLTADGRRGPGSRSRVSAKYDHAAAAVCRRTDQVRRPSSCSQCARFRRRAGFKRLPTAVVACVRMVHTRNHRGAQPATTRPAQKLDRRASLFSLRTAAGPTRRARGRWCVGMRDHVDRVCRGRRRAPASGLHRNPARFSAAAPCAAPRPAKRLGTFVRWPP